MRFWTRLLSSPASIRPRPWCWPPTRPPESEWLRRGSITLGHSPCCREPHEAQLTRKMSLLTVVLVAQNCKWSHCPPTLMDMNAWGYFAGVHIFIGYPTPTPSPGGKHGLRPKIAIITVAMGLKFLFYFSVTFSVVMSWYPQSKMSLKGEPSGNIRYVAQQSPQKISCQVGVITFSGPTVWSASRHLGP